MKVAIIGAGLIGKKRAAALGNSSKLVYVVDKDLARAKELADAYGAKADTDWNAALSDSDAFIIATTNDALSETAARACARVHCLIEKPAARNVGEIEKVIQASQKSKTVVRIGFNHRFHPGLQKAKAFLAGPKGGPLMYIRARYGHGGRVGYEKEWRADPKLSGGGELLDQGVHLIDLCRWLGGEFELEYGRAKTFFWKMPVDDNGFLLLKSPDGKRSAFLHASCTEWKNLFDFEIFCQNAKVEVFGLGRSYGEEEFRIFQMKPEMGPPDITVEKFPGEDSSWQAEWQAFEAEVAGKKTDIATLADAKAALQIVQATYAQL